jgi:leucyl/phenylalanyl-tRNA--protein transferase
MNNENELLEPLHTRVVKRVVRKVTPRVPLVAELGQQLSLESMPFTPKTLIRGYMSGMFFTLNNSKISWHSPPKRALIPIHDFHIPKNVKRLVRQEKFEVRFDTNFEKVIRMCAVREKESQINEEIIDVFIQLHKMGVANSVESWLDGELVGGLYGIRIGKYFGTESQFHTVRDAGKVAFVALFEILKSNGYLLHDVQYMTPYLEQFGAIEMDDAGFNDTITQAVVQPGGWFSGLGN